MYVLFKDLWDSNLYLKMTKSDMFLALRKKNNLKSFDDLIKLRFSVSIKI